MISSKKEVVVLVADAPVKLADISKYLGYSKLSDFSRDWRELSDTGKEQVKSGFKNGTLTY